MPEEIRGKNRPYDIVVIGGGISGLAIAREAAYWGFEVVLLEAGECFAGTSANSLRIVHGGFRYLQTLDLPRVAESLKDQAAALKEFPETVVPLPCVMPLTAGGLKSKWPVRAAGAIYSGISWWARVTAPITTTVTAETIDSTVPVLRGRAPHGALLWHDARITDLSSFAAKFRGDVTKRSGTIIERALVSSVERQGRLFRVCCDRSIEPKLFHSRTVVNAAGPWIDSIRLDGISRRTAREGSLWCRGFNVVVKPQADPTHALGIRSPDGRLYFLVPRGEGTAIGTWYLPFSGDPKKATISDEELDEVLAGVSKALPSFQVSRADVATVEVGILPVRRYRAEEPELQGPFRILDSRGYIEVVSTKLTTFRSQARAVLAKASKYLK